MVIQLTATEALIKIVLRGEVTTEGFGQVCSELLKHPKWSRGGKVVMDCTELDMTAFNQDMTLSWVAAASTNRERLGRVRIAVIAPQPLQFGLLRMWLLHVSENWDAAVMVFRCHDTAVSWLEGSLFIAD